MAICSNCSANLFHFVDTVLQKPRNGRLNLTWFQLMPRSCKLPQISPLNIHCQKNRLPGLGPVSGNLIQLALKAAILCEITRNLGQKVADYGTDRKPICNFLLVNNTN